MPLSSHKLLLLPLLFIFALLALDGFLLSGIRPALPPGEGGQVQFPAFKTKDIYGRIVTQEILQGKMTAVCVWTTKEQSSREILFPLCRLAESQGEKLQLLGLVGDLKEGDGSTLALAREMAGELPPDFLQLMVNDDFYPFLSRVHNVPTICFIDPQGSLIGQPVIGGDITLVEQEFKRILALDSPRSKALRYIHEVLLNQP